MRILTLEKIGKVDSVALAREYNLPVSLARYIVERAKGVSQTVLAEGGYEV